jgi:hypothetical protein
LAAHLDNCCPEEAFVAGLIMEIGLLILFDLRIKGDSLAPPITLEPRRSFSCGREIVMASIIDR